MLDQNKLNTYYVIVAMDLIQKEESFRAEFLKVAQPVYADVMSFIANPNCTCKAKVGKFIGGNRALVVSLINVWDQQNQGKLDMDQIEKENKTENVMGKVFIIKRDPAEFEKFMQDARIQRFSYKNFTVADNGTEWSIFFY
ncbi:MAG: hypothetical protein WC390_11605 [Sulfurimonas sp.]|jgi:hypothetical protein